jgi:hypothetical protein
MVVPVDLKLTRARAAHNTRARAHKVSVSRIVTMSLPDTQSGESLPDTRKLLTNSFNALQRPLQVGPLG